MNIIKKIFKLKKCQSCDSWFDGHPKKCPYCGGDV